MATVTGAIQKMIRQDIQPGIDDALVELSPLFGEIYNSNMGVVRDHIGQDWKVIKTLVTSLAGNFKAIGAVGGDNVVSTSTPFTVHSAPATFPGVEGFVSPGYVQKVFTLQEMLGTLMIPQEFLRADRLTASLGSAVAMTIKQSARMIALMKSNFFFTPDQTNKTLGAGDGSTAVTSGGTSDTTATFVLSSTSRIRNLLPGVRVDLYSANGSTKRNSTALVVYSVDPETKAVRFDFGDGSTTFTSQVLNSDIIVLADSKGNGPAGLESWIKASGTLYTNLALATYPQFKSKITNVAGSLTDDVLRKHLAGFIQSHGAEFTPDTLLTTEGVLNDYVDNFDADRRWAVQGQAQKVVGGFDNGIKFLLNGKAFNFKTGEQVPGGYLYALKMGQQNIKRYMPPKLPGSDSRSEFGNIEFVAGLGGGNDIWKHAHYNSLTTKYVEAPFVCIEEIVPDCIPALKLYGLTEDLA